MNSKIKSYLGFASKSGNLIYGFQANIHASFKNKQSLIILATDLADNTKNKLKKTITNKNIVIKEFGDIETLSRIAGKNQIGIYGITDKNLSNAIIEQIHMTTEGNNICQE